VAITSASAGAPSRCRPPRQRGHVGAQLGGGFDPLDVGEQVSERAPRAQPVGGDRGERAEVGVGVDGDRAEPQPVREQVADHEGAGRLADAALGGDHRGDVGPADRWLLAEQPFELRLLALAVGDE
jgi:hypothetical protein